MLEEFDNFFEFLLGLIGTSNILEVYLNFVRTTHAGPALAKRHDTPATALRLLHDKEPYPHQQENRQNRREHRRPPWRLRRILSGNLNILAAELLIKLRVIVRGIRRDGREFRTIGKFSADRILNDYDL